MNLFKKITVIIILILGSVFCTTEEKKSIPDYLKDLENLIIVQPNREPVYNIEFIHSAEIEHSSATNKWFVDWSDDFWAFSGGDSWFGGLEVDDSGRIYVGNRSSNRIQVFNSTGRYLSSVGGEGEWAWRV